MNILKIQLTFLLKLRLVHGLREICSPLQIGKNINSMGVRTIFQDKMNRVIWTR